MNTQDVLDYIETADDEELNLLSNVIKARKRPPRLMLSSLIGKDAARLAEILPRTVTEYKGRRYLQTCSYYISILHSLTNLVLHNFTLKSTSRGIQMWADHESILEARADDYKHVFHVFTDTLLSLMEEYDTTYLT